MKKNIKMSEQKAKKSVEKNKGLVKKAAPVKKMEVAAHKAAHAETASAPARRYRAVLFQVTLLIDHCRFCRFDFPGQNDAYLPY